MTKKIKEMTPEERKAYQSEWYRANVQSRKITVTINNCSDALAAALIAAIQEEK